jgi:hypothetical protein
VPQRQLTVVGLVVADESITLDIYAHTMPGMQSEAAARFAELVAVGA